MLTYFTQRKKTLNLCACDNDQRERGLLCACDREYREIGVGTGVNATMLSETLQVIGFSEVSRRVVRLQKNPMNLCVYDSEERERGVGAGVNVTMLSETL